MAGASEQIIGSIKVLIGGDAAGLIAAAGEGKEALDELRGEEELTAAAMDTFALAIVGVAAALAGEFIKSSMEAINAQYLLAQQLGGTTESVQVMDKAAQMAGVSSDGLEAAARRLNATLGEVEEKGAGPAYEALQKLGLSAQDLSKMDLDQRFLAIAKRMDDLGYSTQQEAAFLKDLGLRGGTVVGVLQDAGAKITEAREQIEKFGVAVNDIDAEKVHQAQEAFETLNTAVQGVANQIAVGLAPVIIGIGQNFDDDTTKVGGLAPAVTSAMLSAGHDIAQVEDAVIQLGKAIDFVKVGLAALTDFSDEANQKVADAWGIMIDSFQHPIATENFDKWEKDVLSGVGQTTDAAAKLRTQLDNMFGGDTGSAGQTDAQKKAAAALQKQLDSQLKELQNSLQASIFSENQAYQTRLNELNTFLSKKMITQQQYDDLFTRLEQDHAKKLQTIQQQEYQSATQAQTATLNMITNALDAVGNAIQSSGEDQFGIAKAFSVATAVLKGYESITSSYAAGAAIGGPVLGAVFAGLAAVATAGQIASIMAVTSSSSGAPTVAGGSSSSAAAAAATPASAAPGPNAGQTLTLQGLSTDQLYSGTAVRALVQQLIQYQKDGGTLVVIK